MKKNILLNLNKTAIAVLVLCIQSVCSPAQTSNLGLNFDGVDDRVSINTIPTYNIGTGNFTIETWIKADPSQPTQWQAIFGNRELANPANGMSLHLTSGFPYINIGGNYFGSGYNFDLRDNYCHHLAVTRSNGVVTFYIDGVNYASGVLSGSINSTHAYWIGFDDPGSAYSRFKGLIHELRFWNIARTQSQIQNSRNVLLAGNESGLIGYWRMNDNTGQTVNDLSAQNNDGSLGTINTADAADPVYASGCFCTPVAHITAGGPTIFCGGSGSVLLTANSGAGFTYQWKNSLTNLTGATNQTYTATFAGNYRCQITATACSGISNNIITATENPISPSISQSSTSFCGSTTVLLQETSMGTNYNYQWFEDTHLLPGVNSYNLITGHNGTYTCNVTNSCGTYPTPPYTLLDPFLDQYPFATISSFGPLTRCAGGNVYMEVDNSFNFASFQWLKDGVPITGELGPDYTATQSGSYACQMADWFCGQTYTSNWKTVEFNPLPSANITPSGPVTFCAGGSVTLSVPSGINKTYQWKKNGTNIPGATNSSYFTTIGGSFKVTVKNTYTGCSNTTSSPTVITVNQLPSATITPQGPTTFCAGGSVVLKANTGTGFTYKWKKNNVYISGATQSSYTSTTAGIYKTEVTKSNGCSKTSATITVTVPCREGETISAPTIFDVTVFPNPSSGDFTFEFENASEEKISIHVYDVMGKLVLSESIHNSSFIIHHSKLIPGIYSAVITNGENERVLKLVKN